MLGAMVFLIAPGCGGEADRPDHQRQESNEPVITPPRPARFRDEVSVAHILVRYRGSAGSHGIQRSREDALTLIRALSERLTGGESFDSLAVRFSEDEKTRARGGWLEPVPPPRHPDNVFAQRAHELAVGEVSEPVETAEGFHLIRRGPLEYVTVRQILITHAGSIHRPGTTRSPEAARSLAEELRRRILAGDDFGQIAREYNEDATADRGGEVEPFPRGRMVAPFERCAFALAPGETSDVVESVYGFHLIQRLR